MWHIAAFSKLRLRFKFIWQFWKWVKEILLVSLKLIWWHRFLYVFNIVWVTFLEMTGQSRLTQAMKLCSRPVWNFVVFYWLNGCLQSQLSLHRTHVHVPRSLKSDGYKENNIQMIRLCVKEDVWFKKGVDFVQLMYVHSIVCGRKIGHYRIL